MRRLTPVECERLMGFPDGFTDVPWRGKDHSPDGRRYKALGNSFAVNVVRWLGDRIQMVEDICTDKGGGRDSAPRIGTPPPFRDLLIGMARSVVAKEGLE